MKLINARKEMGPDAYKKYPSYVDGLPASIVMSGLGQACATLLAATRGKQNDPHRMLYDDLNAWMCQANTYSPYANKRDLLTAITEGTQRDYVRAQAEALAYLVWLKKFSQAFLKNPDAE
ncbi:type III-B CRISPR module-associated protein Cmr5 [Lujinxingia vulgaris]